MSNDNKGSLFGIKPGTYLPGVNMLHGSFGVLTMEKLRAAMSTLEARRMRIPVHAANRPLLTEMLSAGVATMDEDGTVRVKSEEAP